MEDPLGAGPVDLGDGLNHQGPGGFNGPRLQDLWNFFTEVLIRDRMLILRRRRTWDCLTRFKAEGWLAKRISFFLKKILKVVI